MLNFNARKELKQKDDQQFLDRVTNGDSVVDVAIDQCHSCKHWKVGTLTCTAFKKGIPLGFLTGDYNHTAPFPGDGGVLFEPID